MTFRAVAVVGSGTCDENTYAQAQLIGHLLAQAGVAVVCGGLGGVMEAACKGASESGGTTIGILPGSDPAQANSWVNIPIATGLGEARNTVVIRAVQAVIAVGGEYGTLSEIGFALKVGRPVIGLHTWELGKGGFADAGIQVAATPEDAVNLALSHLP